MKITFFDNIIKLFEDKFNEKIPMTTEQKEVASEILLLVWQNKSYSHDSKQILSAFEKLKPLLPKEVTVDHLRMVTNQCSCAFMVDLNVPDAPAFEPPTISLRQNKVLVTKDDIFKSLGKAWQDLYKLGRDVVGEGSANKLTSHRAAS